MKKRGNRKKRDAIRKYFATKMDIQFCCINVPKLQQKNRIEQEWHILSIKAQA